MLATGQPSKGSAMGYDLHITRKAEWSDDDGPVISADEWRKLIASDADLQLDAETDCAIDDTHMIFASFRGEPGVFGWLDGEICTKNPEAEVVRKAVQIAQKLGAKAQGDDGEDRKSTRLNSSHGSISY